MSIPEHECVREQVALSVKSVYSNKIWHIPEVLATQGCFALPWA